MPPISLRSLSRLPLWHRVVQYCFALFFLFVGVQFYQFFLWATSGSDVYVAKPAAVEAFLPISALLGAKQLLLTGVFDSVHPAGLTIFLLAITTAFLFRKSFCGYLCPVGCASMIVGRLGRRLGISRQPGKVLSILLTLPKYVLLFFFVSMLWDMNVAAIDAFIKSPYNIVADSKMMLFFLQPSVIVLVSLGVLFLGGMLFPGFWCRGLCPYGALLGVFSVLSPVAVHRNKESCIGCERCTKVCPSQIPVHTKIRVTGPECVGCTECITVCPKQDCLQLRCGYSKKSVRIPLWSLAVGTLLAVYLFYAWAQTTGNWNADLPQEMVRMFHKNILQMPHP